MRYCCSCMSALLFSEYIAKYLALTCMCSCCSQHQIIESLRQVIELQQFGLGFVAAWCWCDSVFIFTRKDGVTGTPGNWCSLINHGNACWDGVWCCHSWIEFWEHVRQHHFSTTANLYCTLHVVNLFEVCATAALTCGERNMLVLQRNHFTGTSCWLSTVHRNM